MFQVLNYDVKFESEGVRPPNKLENSGLSISLPNPTAEVLGQKRTHLNLLRRDSCCIILSGRVRVANADDLPIKAVAYHSISNSNEST